MKKISRELRTDVESLVEKVTVEEAYLRVAQKLESALEALEPGSRQLLTEYLNGVPLEKLSQQHRLSLQETQHCIEHSKRQLMTQLQRNLRARQ